MHGICFARSTGDHQPKYVQHKDPHRKDRHDNRSWDPDRTRDSRRLDERLSHVSDADRREVADQMILDTEKYKANIEDPRGNKHSVNLSENFTDYMKQLTDDGDYEFFYITCRQ